MKIILRPLNKNTWSNVQKYRNCNEDLGPYLTRSGGIYTGLTPADEVKLGARLGLDLRQSSDFWKTFFIRTNTRDIYLDTEDTNDELKYLFLKGHKRVKNSLLENKAGANFVLINKDEEAKVSNLASRVTRKAFAAFDKLTTNDMRKVLRLYGENGDNMSPEIVEERLSKLIEGNPSRFLDKWVDNDSREVEVLLEKAVSANSIRKNLNLYKYGSEVIGRSKEEAIHFLENPTNQDIKRSILIEIDAKTSDNEIKRDTKTTIQQILEAEDEAEVEVKELVEVPKKTKKSDT
jgi:hypothetical protein